MSTRFSSLEAVVSQAAFVEVDVALRRGRHIDRDDGELYEFLADAQSFLELLYRRYGCELVLQADGYFYLLPKGDRFLRRRLSSGEMVVGQALTILYLEPSTVQTGGVVTRELLLSRLSGLLSLRDLAKTLEPRKQKFDDERVVAEFVRTRVGQALRGLAALGFIEVLDADRLRLRAALMRFAEPVHGLADRHDAMQQLVREGKVELDDADSEDDEDTGDADGDEADA